MYCENSYSKKYYLDVWGDLNPKSFFFLFSIVSTGKTSPPLPIWVVNMDKVMKQPNRGARGGRGEDLLLLGKLVTSGQGGAPILFILLRPSASQYAKKVLPPI